ncbi:hypothetical protein [Clostridium manihotivorum]|uniref:DUF7922 domain-containing protein n=1 Tax=Clostridium manihotivorum TaxID=2320868 RepID=A0A410DNP8_9CLOT|nr:hypothetical protein [Clostridium manihotivorum]QAA30688.1 hypothetical protein C1I91_02835 [Clostridium manihotivorum]
MSHGKLYRSFIILQEDERGHSVSSDKPLSGYAKIEAKNDKCKITFYAQNLKKDNTKLCMILICSKKDNKQLINLGPVNITEQGKAETSFEYLANDIGGAGILFDKVSGAALAKDLDGKLTFVLGGFMNGETPSDDWKSYKVISAKVKVDEKVEVKVEEKVEHHDEHHHKDDHKDEHKKLDHDEEEKVKVQIKEEIEQEIEKKINREEQSKAESKDVGLEAEDSVKAEEKSVQPSDESKQVADEVSTRVEDKVEKTSSESDEPVEAILENIDDREEDEPKDDKFDQYERSIIDSKANFEDSRQEPEEQYEEPDFSIRGSIGEFFENVVQDFEEIKGFRDIKYCKWYKVPVKDLDVMCNISNYNKYTVVYYPMINYYPYIKKYGHFMIGFKCDDEGRVKYLVYAVPGTKDKLEQPYGGKSGFVTWMPDPKKEREYGYWLMFYDFKNSMIVVPMK